MLRRQIVLLIAIRLSDGDVEPGGPLGAFREEQAMSRGTEFHHIPSFNHHHHHHHHHYPTQHDYTTQTVTHTVTRPKSNVV